MSFRSARLFRAALCLAAVSVSPSIALAADSWADSIVDTARNVPYLSALEKDVIREHNKVRVDPVRYAEEVIKPIIALYNGTLLKRPGEIALRTQEGVSAAQECYRALKAMSPTGALRPSKAVTQAARDHAADQARSGQTGHTGSDGSQMQNRIMRYGTTMSCGENIAYGGYTKNVGQRVISQLLIDDGVANRGHRKNIMKAGYTTLGVAINSHPTYGNVCVLDYSAAFSPKAGYAEPAVTAQTGGTTTPVTTAATRSWEMIDARNEIGNAHVDISRINATIADGRLTVSMKMRGVFGYLPVNAAQLAAGKNEWSWYVNIDADGDGTKDFGMGLVLAKKQGAAPARLRIGQNPQFRGWLHTADGLKYTTVKIEGKVAGTVLTFSMPLASLPNYGDPAKVALTAGARYDNGRTVVQDSCVN